MELEIGKKVRWFYQIDRWSKPTDEIVIIADKPLNSRVRVNREKGGIIVDGGYIMTDELFEIKG
jgi:hypothetical protein